MDERVELLTKMFKDRDWFDSVDYDKIGRIVVYVKYMNREVFEVPSDCMGTHVLTHFATSKNLTREDFVTTIGPKVPTPFVVADFLQKAREAQAKGIDTGFVSAMDEDAESVFEDLSERNLQNELDRLEKMCGSNSLQDIFYEIQDGKNAVTNLSAKYPEVRQSMEKLYDQYGFDVIFNNLDG